jgi:hypothetical protein
MMILSYWPKERDGERNWNRPSGWDKGKKKVVVIISDSTDGLLLSQYTLRLLLHHIMKSALLKQLSPSVLSLMKSECLIGEDKAYDSDPLDEKLAAVEYGIAIISPHRGWRRKRLKKTQDGLALRHSYKHSRWKIEREVVVVCMVEKFQTNCGTP